MDEISVGGRFGVWLRRTSERLEALERRIDELIVRLDERPTTLDEKVDRPRLRLDDLTRAEVERIVAAEGRRLYGDDWLKVTERR